VNLFLAATVGFVAMAGNALAIEALLPDPKLTPGRVAASEKDRGGVTVAMEQKVFARYKLPWGYRAEFKIDHLIPPELGGADTIDNLWPQRTGAKPYGAERKELLTEVLLKKVRAGTMTIAEAQETIRRDWIDAFIDHLGMVYMK
jgi:hypothetical protein